MSRLISSITLFLLVCSILSSPPPRRTKSCPRGWLQFESTCYFKLPDLLNFEEATQACKKKEAAVFESGDSFEWEAVRVLFPHYYLTWVKAEVEEELVWLYEPYDETLNGKSTASKCIACYSSPTRHYNYYYSCLSKFHVVCERALDDFHQWVQ
uniref:C-type lectin domain-containing protein n=1 Tax=Caenorhabditis japonica TaxID=281687 RepID=A0A8R1DPL4_CAEJA